QSGHDAPGLNVENVFGEAGAGPDQMTHFGDEPLTYDAAGRVTKDGTRKLTWDAKGRLVKVLRGDLTEEYVYDHADRRALKRTTHGGVTETVKYIAKDAEERDGELVRYVFLGDERLARLDAVGSATGSAAGSAAGSGAPRESGAAPGAPLPPWELAWLALGAAG